MLYLWANEIIINTLVKVLIIYLLEDQTSFGILLSTLFLWTSVSSLKCTAKS